MTPDKICQQVTEAAFEFDKCRLWQTFDNEDCLVIRLPRKAHPMVGVIMGAGGEEYGLTLFRGENAAACFLGLGNPLGPGDDITEQMDILGFSMSPFSDMPADAKALVVTTPAPCLR